MGSDVSRFKSQLSNFRRQVLSNDGARLFKLEGFDAINIIRYFAKWLRRWKEVLSSVNSTRNGDSRPTPCESDYSSGAFTKVPVEGLCT